MGIDKNRFVNLSIDSSLVCGLCAQILSHPVFCRGCDSFICQLCSEMFTCEHPEPVQPIAKQQDDSFSDEVSLQDDHPILPRQDYSPHQQAQIKVYRSLRAKCIHAGCIKVESLRHLDAHQNSCRFNPDNLAALYRKHCTPSCEYDNDLSQHLHVKTCPLLPRKCNSCGQAGIFQKDFEEHSCIKYLLELKNVLQQKNEICRQEAEVLDANELNMTEQYERDNTSAITQYKTLLKENKNLKNNIAGIQTQFQKEIAKLESSIIPRMRIFCENSQERVLCFENRQADSLLDFTKQLLYYNAQLDKDIKKEVNLYQNALQDTKKGILKNEEKKKLIGQPIQTLKNNFMVSQQRRMKF